MDSPVNSIWRKARTGVYSFFDDRIHFKNLLQPWRQSAIPVRKPWFLYYFGGITLFLFINQVLTGILLLMFYRPGDAAFDSVKFIMTKVEFGWLIRSLHSWGANLLVGSAMTHMFIVYFARAYRKPRDLTWYSGMALLGLGTALGFSGLLLGVSQLSFFATRVGTEIVSAIPLAGNSLLEFIRNGDEVTIKTISRFFGFHVALLPALFVAVLAIHLMLIKRMGLSQPHTWEHTPEQHHKTVPFFPNFVMRDLFVWLIVLNVLAILAFYFPTELGTKADAFASAPAGIKPEWYFLFIFQTLKYIPAMVFSFPGEQLGIIAFGIAVLLWCLIPVWDRKTPTGRRNRILNYIGLFIVMYIIVMTIVGFAT